MTNSVDTDEMARDEPSHLDLQCLYKYLFRYPGLRKLIQTFGAEFQTTICRFFFFNGVVLYSRLSIAMH